MAERVYECMFIFNANAHAKNPAATAKTVEGLANKVGGELLASRLWNEQKLAYPIEGHRKGVYWLSYIKMDAQNVPKFNRACQLTDTVLRHLLIAIDPRLVDAMVAVARGEATPDEIASGAVEEESEEVAETAETAEA